jgi:hypothetical protein
MVFPTSRERERDPPRIQKKTPKDEFLLPLVSLGMVHEYGWNLKI